MIWGGLSAFGMGADDGTVHTLRWEEEGHCSVIHVRSCRGTTAKGRTMPSTTRAHPPSPLDQSWQIYFRGEKVADASETLDNGYTPHLALRFASAFLSFSSGSQESGRIATGRAPVGLLSHMPLLIECYSRFFQGQTQVHRTVRLIGAEPTKGTAWQHASLTPSQFELPRATT